MKSQMKPRFRPKSMMDLRRNTEFKKAVKEEVEDLVNQNLSQYLQTNRIPVAAIDIRVNGTPVKTQRSYSTQNIDSNRNVQVNVSTSSYEITPNGNTGESDKTNNNNNWMCWTDNNPKPIMKQRNGVSYGHGCNSPFSRPNSAYQDRGTPMLRSKSTDTMVVRPARITNEVDKAVETCRTTNSVAVGPDRHYAESATNTKQSYQLSDYLKKSMDLNDPYERKIFSCLMEIVRKKNQSKFNDDSDEINSISGPADPVLQISEYKSKYRHPSRNGGYYLPTANVENWQRVPPATQMNSTPNHMNIKTRPPLCPHKSPFKIQGRPATSAASKFRHGEQFLY